MKRTALLTVFVIAAATCGWSQGSSALKEKMEKANDLLYKQGTYAEAQVLFEALCLWAHGEWDHTSTTWRSPEFLPWLFNEAPNRDYVAVNDRWDQKMRHLNGGYYTTEYGAGLKGVDHAWEEDRGIGYSYGSNRNENLADYRSAPELIFMFADLVSRGGTPSGTPQAR